MWGIRTLRWTETDRERRGLLDFSAEPDLCFGARSVLSSPADLDSAPRPRDEAFLEPDGDLRSGDFPRGFALVLEPDRDGFRSGDFPGGFALVLEPDRDLLRTGDLLGDVPLFPEPDQDLLRSSEALPAGDPARDRLEPDRDLLRSGFTGTLSLDFPGADFAEGERFVGSRPFLDGGRRTPRFGDPLEEDRAARGDLVFSFGLERLLGDTLSGLFPFLGDLRPAAPLSRSRFGGSSRPSRSADLDRLFENGRSAPRWPLDTDRFLEDHLGGDRGRSLEFFRDLDRSLSDCFLGEDLSLLGDRCLARDRCRGEADLFRDGERLFNTGGCLDLERSLREPFFGATSREPDRFLEPCRAGDRLSADLFGGDLRLEGARFEGERTLLGDRFFEGERRRRDTRRLDRDRFDTSRLDRDRFLDGERLRERRRERLSLLLPFEASLCLSADRFAFLSSSAALASASFFVFASASSALTMDKSNCFCASATVAVSFLTRSWEAVSFSTTSFNAVDASFAAPSAVRTRSIAAFASALAIFSRSAAASDSTLAAA